MKKIPRFRPCLSWQTIASILKELVVIQANTQAGIRSFESAFAGYIGVKQAILVPSGRTGLRLILEELALKKGTGVMAPAFTFWAVPRMISDLGLEVVPVDIDPFTCSLDPALIEKNTADNIKAIIPTHLYGLPCDMDAITAQAKKRGLFVIEDCVQACGARYKGKRAGSLGDAAYFSFGITKSFPLLGGGMVTTNNDPLAARIRARMQESRFLGSGPVLGKTLQMIAMKAATSGALFDFLLFPLIRYFSRRGKDIVHEVFSEHRPVSRSGEKRALKLLPSYIQEKIGVKGLASLDSLNAQRATNAQHLLRELEGCAHLVLPPGEGGNIFTNFPIRTQKRDELARELIKYGVDTEKGYMEVIQGGFPAARQLHEEILHLPVSPSLKPPELTYIAQSVRSSLQRVYL